MDIHKIGPPCHFIFVFQFVNCMRADCSVLCICICITVNLYLCHRSPACVMGVEEEALETVEEKERRENIRLVATAVKSHVFPELVKAL